VNDPVAMESRLDQGSLPTMKITLGDTQAVTEHLAVPIKDRSSPCECFRPAEDLTNEVRPVHYVHRRSTKANPGYRFTGLER